MSKERFQDICEYIVKNFTDFQEGINLAQARCYIKDLMCHDFAHDSGYCGGLEVDVKRVDDKILIEASYRWFMNPEFVIQKAEVRIPKPEEQFESLVTSFCDAVLHKIKPKKI